MENFTQTIGSRRRISHLIILFVLLSFFGVSASAQRSKRKPTSPPPPVQAPQVPEEEEIPTMTGSNSTGFGVSVGTTVVDLMQTPSEHQGYTTLSKVRVRVDRTSKLASGVTRYSLTIIDPEMNEYLFTSTDRKGRDVRVYTEDERLARAIMQRPSSYEWARVNLTVTQKDATTPVGFPTHEYDILVQRVEWTNDHGTVLASAP